MTDFRLILSSPGRLTARALPYLPGTLVGGAGISITQIGATYTIGLVENVRALLIGAGVTAPEGGTGITSYVVGDLLYASAENTLSKRAAVAVGSVLASAGVNTPPAWSSSPTLSTSLTVPLLIGGAGADSTLTLRSTSGVGTTDAIIFQVGNNGATEALRINNQGRELIGLTEPLGLFAAQFLSRQNAGAPGFVGGCEGLFQFSNDDSAAFLGFFKNRETTKGPGHVTVQNGDNLGEINFSGSDGSTYVQSSYLTVHIDGPVSANLIPTALWWGAMGADGSNLYRFKIGSDSSVSQISNDGGAGPGPYHILDRQSASPAANDQLGVLLCKGRDSGGNVTDYAFMEARILDPINGSEDGELRFNTLVAGAGVYNLSLSNGVILGNPTGSYKGAGTLNAAGTIYVNNDPVSSLAANNAFTGTNTFSTTAASVAPVTLTSTDAGASFGPLLNLLRDSASPAAADQLAAIRFLGKDSAANTMQYGSIGCQIDDPTNPSEDSQIYFTVVIGGAETFPLAIGNGIVLGGAAGGFQGPGTMNLGGDLSRGGTKVVGTRVTGYTAFTGTNTNRATAYDTATITLVQLAERVRALQIDLTAHGLIGA